MKILLANVGMAESGSEAAQFMEKVLLPVWRANFNFVRQKDTEIVARIPAWGITGLEGFLYSYIDTLNAQSVLHAAIQAEKEGFDAVLITCFGDPLLYQIRQAVNIPVASLGESSMFLAATMGNKFGVVTIGQGVIYEMEHVIAKYGLEHRYAGARPIQEDDEKQMMALIDARHSIERFKEAARELIAEGAEVIIPGCGIMSPALRLAPGAEAEYPKGLTEVDGVPVLDVMATALAAAQTMATLKRAGSSWISRKGLFAQATAQAKEHGQMVLNDPRITYWDIKI